MKSCGDVRGRIQILQWNYHTVSCVGLPLPDMVEQASLFCHDIRARIFQLR